MHTLSAPAGAGKTSFSYALIAAVTREPEENPRRHMAACLSLTKSSERTLLTANFRSCFPARWLVWTSEHDVGAKEWPKLAALGKTPAARFDKAALATIRSRW